MKTEEWRILCMVWGKNREQPGQNYTRRPYQRNLPSDMLQNEDLRHASRITTKDNFHPANVCQRRKGREFTRKRCSFCRPKIASIINSCNPTKSHAVVHFSSKADIKKTYLTVNVIMNPQLLKFIPTLCPGWVNRLTCIITVYWHSVGWIKWYSCIALV